MNRIERLIVDGQDREAMELANREQARLEEWGMSPMRRVDEWHHEVSTGPRRAWIDVVGPFLFGLVVFGIIWGLCFLGQLHGGWPA